MQVLSKFETQQWQRSSDWTLEYGTNSTYFSTAVLQQNVDVLFVLKMVIEVHNVFMVQHSVQLNFSVNLTGARNKTVTIVI